SSLVRSASITSAVMVSVGGKALGKLIAPKQVELGAGATKRLKLKPTAAQHRAVTGRARVVINLKLIFTYADGRQVTVKRHLRA
ncbi:MAG TPA: hypothetical protein PK324_21850, partial [Nocardioides sp.]|nr:hypothetical protein [Nocardioides sp.]